MGSSALSGEAPSVGDGQQSGHQAADTTVVRVRHYGRAIAAVIVVALVAAVGYYGFATNPNIKWSIVRQYLFDPNILRGLRTTLEMTVIGTAVSLIGALIVALMRTSQSRVIRSVAWFYVYTFRGIPIILLLIFVGNLGLFVKTITAGIPFTDVVFFSRPSASLLTPFVASIIGLSLAGSAYMGEIVRGGLLSVGQGQRQAAKALGLNALQTTRHVILPPALRVIVPPMGNEVIAMLKATAIVTVIGGGDLLTVTQSLAGLNYRTIEMLLVAAIWYFAVIGVMSIGQYYLEKRTAER